MKIQTIDEQLRFLHQLHRQGELEQAKTGYEALLKERPQLAAAWHALGIIFTQQENFNEALPLLKKAQQLAPSDPSIALHLATVLKFQGDLIAAKNLLKKTIAQFPEYLPAYNNLGTVYFVEENYTEAIEIYRSALAKAPHYWDVYYNLGLALVKKELLDEAIPVYQDLLEHDPNHFAARYHLACTWMQKNNLKAAIREFSKIDAAHPHHFETQTNLATCFLQQGALKEAKTHYLKALNLQPDDQQILFNLGVISMQLGDSDAAIQFYQRCNQQNPDNFAVHNNLGAAFLARGYTDYALHHFKEAKRLQPDNQSIAYLIEMLNQKKPLLAAPAEYIQSLFDTYADHYDQHLLMALDYKIPTLLTECLKELRLPQGALTILDLGCGTGLCAEVLKPYANQLVGVDLSGKMLEQARTKGGYDHLHQAHLTEFLTNPAQNFDLIIAADVLVYFGDLAPLFAGVARALKPQGLWIFNTEITLEHDFKMNQSGRFAHRRDYIDQLAKQHHFVIQRYTQPITRLQNNEPVMGHFYVLRKES